MRSLATRSTRRARLLLAIAGFGGLAALLVLVLAGTALVQQSIPGSLWAVNWPGDRSSDARSTLVPASGLLGYQLQVFGYLALAVLAGVLLGLRWFPLGVLVVSGVLCAAVFHTSAIGLSVLRSVDAVSLSDDLIGLLGMLMIFGTGVLCVPIALAAQAIALRRRAARR